MSEKKLEITIPRKIVQNLLHHAQQTPEQEVCGLISSLNNIPCRCFPIENTADQPESFFNLDPQQQIQAMAEMRENNEQLFAIYHSHPSAPAIPSSTDIEQANYPDALYIIISLNTKGILELRAYQLANAQFTEVPLRLY
ncbi:MAG: hypothetical protein DRQ62_03485 [Gammaproteobacteria bacterium]|nr:MAG: hypothetical protein DRQ62_03485 [Gammaproteobacteria bacterium]